jgi:hypothetical protein
MVILSCSGKYQIANPQSQLVDMKNGLSTQVKNTG